MTYEIYRYIFIGAAILCGIMLLVSLLIFIFLKIPKVISDLSGATARKAIKNIRKQNEASGDKSYKVSAFNEARGKLTEKISASGNLMQQQQSQFRGMGTTKIDTVELPAYNASNETTVLGAEMDSQAFERTETWEQPAGETTVLGANENVVAFAVEYDITFIHTNEIITAEMV